MANTLMRSPTRPTLPLPVNHKKPSLTQRRLLVDGHQLHLPDVVELLHVRVRV
jgi:hypothetical protein